MCMELGRGVLRINGIELIYLLATEDFAIER
jgi:hypothetical protein